MSSKYLDIHKCVEERRKYKQSKIWTIYRWCTYTSKKKKKYLDKAQSLKNISIVFKNRTTDEYLQRIANNFQL